MHLRVADLLGDLRLRQVLGEAQPQDLALGVVEDVGSGVDRRPVLDQLEAGVLAADALGHRGVVAGLRAGAGGRPVERDGPPRGAALERLEHVGLADLEQGGDLGHRRRTLELVAELRDRALDRADALLQAAGDAQGPDAVAEVAAQLAEDRRPGEGRERDPAVGVVALEGGHEPEAGDLEQVLAGLDSAAVAQREAAGERQEAADELLARVLVARERVVAQQLLLGREGVDGTAGRRQVSGSSALRSVGGHREWC